jgi:hypothetical protein
VLARRPSRFAALAFLTAAIAAVCVPAWADSAREREDSQKADAQQNAAEKEAEQAAAAKAPPPAIPGAAANPDAVIPADRASADLAPNDALFDAITRDDLNAARDAMNRGAELQAHNVLGQTPLDASIDLNRNAITFLLLSLRGADGVSSRPATASPVQTVTAKSNHTKHGKTTHATLASTNATQADGGTPKPEAGFLGF